LVKSNSPLKGVL